MVLKTEINLNKDERKQINITSNNKPQIDLEIQNSWQKLLNLMSEFLDAQITLIMKVNKDNFEIYKKNNNKDNPYKIGDQFQLGTGLLGENILGLDKLLEYSETSNNKFLNENTELKSNINYYLGFPIKWPDGEFFGLLCLMDFTNINLENNYINLLKRFKREINKDLELIIKNEKLKERTRRDFLTNLWDRGHIVRLLENEINRVRRSDSQLSVLLGDIDDFKEINDNFGHDIGDEILRKISRIMKNESRKIDYIGRYGGEEFIYILPDTSIEKASDLAERIRKQVENYKFIENENFNVTISFGVTSSKENDNTAKIIRRADNLLFEAKNKGKNNCSIG